MRKINFFIFNLIVILLLAGCSSGVWETETKDIEETTSVTTDMDSDIPGEEEVLRFWADHYNDIVDSNVPSINVLEEEIYVNLYDYDGDTMPEMILSYINSDWEFINIFCDVNIDLDDYNCALYFDLDGNEIRDISNNPIVVFENATKNKHYVFPYLTSDADTLVSGFYDIVFVKGEDLISSPLGTRIKYVEDSNDSESERSYYDILGNNIDENEYYSNYSIYNYLLNIDGHVMIDGEWVNIPHISEGSRLLNFNKSELVIYDTDVDKLYSDMLNAYFTTNLEEDSLGDPYYAIDGSWKLSETNVYGWSTTRDYELVFDEGTLTIIEEVDGKISEYTNVPYCIEYDYRMDGLEPWGVRIMPFGDFGFLNAKISVDGKTMELGVGSGGDGLSGGELDEDYFTGLLILSRE